eukprot:scpid38462/ scgid34259/ 
MYGLKNEIVKSFSCLDLTSSNSIVSFVKQLLKLTSLRKYFAFGSCIILFSILCSITCLKILQTCTLECCPIEQEAPLLFQPLHKPLCHLSCSVEHLSRLLQGVPTVAACLHLV